MPTVREAARRFDQLRGEVRSGMASLAAEREAVAAERTRVLDGVTRNFALRLRTLAPDVAALTELDAGAGLGMDPSAHLARMAEERKSLARERATHERGLAAARDAYGTEAASLTEATQAHAADKREAQAGLARLAGYDPRFLAAHAAVEASGLAGPPDITIRKAGLAARLLAPGLRRARAAIGAFEAAGGDYFAIRDADYLPLRDRLGALRAALPAAEEGIRQRRREMRSRADYISRREEALAAVVLRQETAEAGGRDPHVALMSGLRDWLARHVEAFEASAALRDPKAADPLGRLRGAGLLSGGDLAALGHRFSLGQAERALMQREEAQLRLHGQIEGGLNKLRKAERAGAGARTVPMDLSKTGRSVQASLDGIASMLRSIEPRRTPAATSAAMARGSAAAETMGSGALLFWMLAAATQANAVAAGEAAAAETALSSGHGDVASLHVAMPGLDTGIPGIGVSIPDFQVAVPDIQVSVPDIPMPTADYGMPAFG